MEDDSKVDTVLNELVNDVLNEDSVYSNNNNSPVKQQMAQKKYRVKIFRFVNEG